MSSIPKYTPTYTVSDYEQWSGDWELWQGAAVAMTPSPFGRHQLIGANVIVAFRNALRNKEGKCHVLYELDWRVSNDTVVRPDVVIVCGDVPEGHMESPPTLIVEILSPTTADKDRTAKRDLYEQQGVKHYLLADPDTNTLTALELVAGKYNERPITSELILDLREDIQITIQTSDVFE